MSRYRRALLSRGVRTFAWLLAAVLFMLPAGCGGDGKSAEMRFTERYRDSRRSNFPDISFTVSKPLRIQASRTDGNSHVIQVTLHDSYRFCRQFPDSTGSWIKREIRANRAMYERLRGEMPASLESFEPNGDEGNNG